MTEKRDWRQEAKDDAKAMAMHYLDEMVEMLCSGSDVSDDILNDYTCGDSYHHEAHIDRESYSLLEAAELLDELSEHTETDSGLWQDMSPMNAIGCQANYTYGNAVASAWRRIVEEINEDDLHCSVAAIKILGDNGWGDHLKVVAAAVLSNIINPEEE
jgi:hypothetical protein